MYRGLNLRSDDPEAIARASAFMVAHADRGVRARPEAEVRRAMDLGQAIVVEKEENQEICACSLIYQYPVKHSGTLFSEIGTMRVVTNGLGLQVFLATVHLMQLELEDFYYPSRRIFAVVKQGTPSERNLVDKVGMTNWSPSPDLVILRDDAGVPFDLTKRTITAEVNSVKEAFKSLHNWHIKGNRFQTPKGEVEICLEMGWFNPALLVQR